MWKKIKGFFYLDVSEVKKWEKIPRCGAIPQSRDSPHSWGLRVFVPKINNFSALIFNTEN